MTSIDTMAEPGPAKPEKVETGLQSPPETNMKDNSSDSDLSDLEPEPDTNELQDLQPHHYSPDGSVPVFTPTMEEFADFQRYVSALVLRQPLSSFLGYTILILVEDARCQ